MDTDSQKRFDKKVSQLGLPVVTAYYDVDYRKNPKVREEERKGGREVEEECVNVG